LQALSEERDSLSDDCDSGNDEPSDYFPLERGASNSNTPQVGHIYAYLLVYLLVDSNGPGRSLRDSVADPDPRVFGPPGSGSGSISQRYGS
jgi:hypothetical protein